MAEVTASVEACGTVIGVHAKADPKIHSVEEVDREAVFNNLSFRYGVGLYPNPAKLRTNKLGFNYAEHCFIGDAIKLKLDSGQLVDAQTCHFTFPSGLQATYRQINGLASDFCATSDLISSGPNEKDQARRFQDAYNTLAQKSPKYDNAKEAMDILDHLQTEVGAADIALRNFTDRVD